MARHLSDENCRRPLENIPIGLYSTSPNGEILAANTALAEILGYPNRESLMAANAADLYVNQEDYHKEHDLLDKEGVVRGFEMQLRRADGQVIWVRDTFRAIKDADGNILFFEGNLEDITAQTTQR